MTNIPVVIPYGDTILKASLPMCPILFDGTQKKFEAVSDFEGTLLAKLNAPIGCASLKEKVQGKEKILILVDDNTRVTPVDRILPVLLEYLLTVGVEKNQLQILVALGTHRQMTEAECIKKIGEDVYREIPVAQHDCDDLLSMTSMGNVIVNDITIPVIVNKKAVEADFIIGLGNIIPHCDAGFSAGGKVVQPGICGRATTAATHLSGAILAEIPLGQMVGNPCREGINQVAKKVGLSFLINVVMTPAGDVVDFFVGDFIKAHEAGCALSKQVYGIQIPALADIVIVSASPGDIDFWQGEKGLVGAYFAVKPGGIIILAASCHEGLEHNHPKLREWLTYSYAEAKAKAIQIPLDSEEDLIAADIAMGNARAREKAKVFLISEGLSKKEIALLGHQPFETLQAAIDEAFLQIPKPRVGILPRGGDCLPFM